MSWHGMTRGSAAPKAYEDIDGGRGEYYGDSIGTSAVGMPL